MHESKIYAMGGYNGRIRMNSVERYDPDANQWELISPMLRQRSDASAAALQDKVCIQCVQYKNEQHRDPRNGKR